MGNRIQIAVDVTEMALLEITSVNQFSFVPEYRNYIRLGKLETIPNLH